MRFPYFILALAPLAIVGCDNKPASAPPATAPAKAPVEVDAPGVHVEAGGGKGVEVKAPGAEVEVPPAKK